jgi:hypothetical protein
MNGIVQWGRAQGHTPSTFAQLVPYRQEANPPSPTAPDSLKSWWRELRAAESSEPSGVVESAVVGLRHNAEGAAIGALLAFIDTDLGGLDLAGRVPLDWAGAALFYALSIKDAGNANSLSSDFRAMGQSCTTVAMYRMVHKWRESSKGIPRNIVETTGDPVLAAGKNVAF